MRALPRVRSEATRPSSHTMKAPSRLSHSLFQAMSCSCNSMTIADTTTASKKGALNQSVGRDQHHDEGACPGKPCNAPPTVNRGLSPYNSNIDPPDVARKQGRRSITPTTLKGVCGFRFLRRRNLNKPTARTTLHEQQKSNKELPSLAFFFYISLREVHISTKSATIQAVKPTCIAALGGCLDYVSIHQRNLHLFSPFFQGKKGE
jgi:hypothetical protein